METPQFEHAPEDYTFQVNEEVYLIDKNDIDIFKARIDKINTNGLVVTCLEDDNTGPMKIDSPKRVILHTPANDEIYNQQKQIREELKPEIEANKSEEEQVESSEDAKDDSIEEKEEEKPKETKSKQTSPKPKKLKKKKIKRSQIFDKPLIIKTAWHNGIHDTKQFHSLVKKNIKALVDAFEQYHSMMKCSDNPPFPLGGNMKEQDIKKFWSQSLSLWQKQFNDAFSVNTDDFIKKISSAYKLEHQMESNAREALRFFFDVDGETNFFQFCALLSLFGPAKTMFRKIGHFLHCPEELKDSVTYVDIDDVNGADESTCLNEFVISSGQESETSIFNIPGTDTTQAYLVDGNGNTFSSWMEVFDKFQNKEEDKHNSQSVELEVDE